MAESLSYQGIPIKMDPGITGDRAYFVRPDRLEEAADMFSRMTWRAPARSRSTDQFIWTDPDGSELIAREMGTTVEAMKAEGTLTVLPDGRHEIRVVTHA